jgi:EAL domain-containing protein (putative c-di-GMP-specific phosphodiesterase class I)
LEALISMAHNLDLKVIAEGAEEQSEVEVLEALQCDIVQGYYFSRPIPFDTLLEQLHADKTQRKDI